MPAHNQRPSQWPVLLGVARELIAQVSDTLGGYEVPWSFGGGTAMMLQIDHRESHDIDLFLDDAQFLGYFDPQKFDFEFSIMPGEYGGDGSRFQKFAFADLGEIDFIVSSPLSSAPYVVKEVSGASVRLETLAEIITKKIYYRGSEAKPRDVFDIAAASQAHRGDIVAALSLYPDKVRSALDRLSKLNPEFVNRAIASLMIKPAYLHLLDESLGMAQSVLEEALTVEPEASATPTKPSGF